MPNQPSNWEVDLDDVPFDKIAVMAQWCHDSDLPIMFYTRSHVWYDGKNGKDPVNEEEKIDCSKAATGYIRHFKYENHERRIYWMAGVISNDDLDLFHLRFKGIVKYRVLPYAF